MPYFRPSVKYVSFDVFDTIVTRNVYRPGDLFTRMAFGNQVLRSVNHPTGFPNMRMQAERRVREDLRGIEEVTLYRIVEQLSSELGLSVQDREKLFSEEINHELRSVFAIQSIIDLIARTREEGKKVLFVSDMYLPEEAIRSVLIQVGVFLPDDRLFVSSAIGKKKATGSLFKHVMQELAVEPDQIVHVGDYLLSDYLVPQLKCGIKSYPVRLARNNIYEQVWGESCCCLLCSNIAGASRTARVSKAPSSGLPSEKALYDIGCNVLAPILCGFTLWLLRQAVNSGKQRLYFLSRDGEVLHEIAREIGNRLGLSIEFRYLHVSRMSVFPALTGVSTGQLDLAWLKEDNIVLTPRILADRLKVDCVRLCELLTRSGINLGGPDGKLDSQVVDLICQKIATDDDLLTLVSASGQKALSLLEGYLQQEGLFDGIPFALVDLGWHGSIQSAISHIFETRLGDAGISGYYFGMDRHGSELNDKSGYFFDAGVLSGVARFQHLFRVLLEVMCSGRHGMVHEYHRGDQGTYFPRCRAPEHPLNIEYVEHMRDGVCSFLRIMDFDGLSSCDTDHMRSKVLKALQKLFFMPSLDEAIALGNFRFAADQAGHGLDLLARPFSLASAINYLTKRSYAERATVSSWFFASWVRSGLWVRLFLLPLVVMLRGFYLGSGYLTFCKMKAVDFFNRCVGRKIGLDRIFISPHKNDVK